MLQNNIDSFLCGVWWSMHIVCVHVRMYVCVCDCVCTQVGGICAYRGQSKTLDVLLCHFPPTCVRQGLSLHGSFHLCQACWSVSSWDLSVLTTVVAVLLVKTSCQPRDSVFLSQIKHLFINQITYLGVGITLHPETLSCTCQS